MFAPTKFSAIKINVLHKPVDDMIIMVWYLYHDLVGCCPDWLLVVENQSMSFGWGKLWRSQLDPQHLEPRATSRLTADSDSFIHHPQNGYMLLWRVLQF